MSELDLAGPDQRARPAGEELSAGTAFPAGRPGRADLFDALEGSSARQRLWVFALLLLAVAFAARAPVFGNPVLHVDEQFYLLVGDRMLHGALPFVDIWDRKPVGLFLIYAAIRLLGGEGIVQYQVVATLFAAATALIIAAIAARFARPLAALLAGAAYLLFLGIFGGEGGQSPVFYNLPVALAALLSLRAVARPGDAARLLRLGAGAMLLTGVAMQIKYTAVFEGVFFGAALLWCGWRSGLGAVRLLGFGAAWVALALLPTALALLWYVALGHADAFVFANFTSVFQRTTAISGSASGRLAQMTGLLLPLVLCAASGRWPRRAPGVAGRPERVRAHDFAVGWSLAAVAGVLVFGTFYDHYALPLLVPLAAASAPLLGDRQAGLGASSGSGGWHLPFMVFVPLFGAIASTVVVTRHVWIRGDGSQVRAIADYLQPRLRDCLFVHQNDEPILYHLTGSCLPTRYAFSGHLNDLKESGATGADQEAEVRRILDGRPTYVVSTGSAMPRNTSQTWQMVVDELDRNYRPVFGVPVHERMRYVYERLPGH